VPSTTSAAPCATALTQPTTTTTSLGEASDRRRGWKFTEIPFTVREGSAYAVGAGWFFAWSGAPDRSEALLNDGLLVDIDSGEWAVVPPAPIEARYLASAVWTGAEFVVFGGHSFDASFTDGAVYDPTERGWRRLAASPFSSAPYAATTWTGTGVVVWMPGEDAGRGDVPRPSSGQMACYDTGADAWSTLPSPPVTAVDVAMFPTETGLVLVGGPSMHDLGVVGVPTLLTATTYSVEAGSWSRPVLGPEAESGRAFELAAGRLGVLTEDLVVRGIRDDGWAPLTELPESCWWATGASSNGGVVYLKAVPTTGSIPRPSTSPRSWPKVRREPPRTCTVRPSSLLPTVAWWSWAMPSVATSRRGE
jgi:hypothetical protein